jgi:hypothetical protein
MSEDLIIPVGEELPPLNPASRKAPQDTPRPKRKGKSADRFAVINAFTDDTIRGLTRAEIVVWLILWRDSREGVARTAQSDMARRAGCSERTVGRAVKDLERAGLLTVSHQGGLNRGVSVYRVTPLASPG